MHSGLWAYDDGSVVGGDGGGSGRCSGKLSFLVFSSFLKYRKLSSPFAASPFNPCSIAATLYAVLVLFNWHTKLIAITITAPPSALINSTGTAQTPFHIVHCASTYLYVHNIAHRLTITGIYILYGAVTCTVVRACITFCLP